MLATVLLLLQFINPPNVHKPTGYTHAVKAPGCQLVFISGQVALDVKGGIVGPGDFARQADQVYRNLDEVLRASGAAFKDVVKINSYVVGLDQTKRQQLRDARAKFMGQESPPPSTLIGVQALARPEFMLEVEVIACGPMEARPAGRVP